MAAIKEDRFEEEEFGSLSPFEQQRFMKKTQELDKCFRELQTCLKRRFTNEREFLDIQELEIYEEQYDDHINKWTYQITSWEQKHSNKQRLSARLKEELEKHSNNYKEIYNSIVQNINTAEIERNENLELNINDTRLESTEEPKDVKSNQRYKPETEAELEECVSKLENQICDLNERIDLMYRANQVVGVNIETLKHENFALKKQNKSQENKIKNLLTCDHCNQDFTDKTTMIQHIMMIHVTKEHKCDSCGEGFKTISG